MKKISLLIFSLIFSFLLINKVSASSATISVSSNKSRVIVGDTVTITVRISSSSNLGSWNFDVVPSSNLTFVNSSFGGLFVADVAATTTTKNKSYTFTFKAKSSGTANVKVSNYKAYDYDTLEDMTVSAGSTSFTAMTQSELEQTYSKNNYLSKLEVEGHTLNEEFNKETLEYNLELEYGTESINIITNTEDYRSDVEGDGNVTLSQGLNVIKIVVTAENGSTRTYIINATVKELDPINVTIDNKKYSVIRDAQFLPATNSSYQSTTIMINDKEVPAYYNSIIGFTLIGLKDESGNIDLYIYKDGNYILYEEYSFNQLNIYFLDMDETLLKEGYEKREITIGDKIVTAYKKEGYEYPILYGLNIETGNKNLYKYDYKENTLQKVEDIAFDNETLYFNIILCSFGFIVISYFLFIILLVKKNKQQKNFLEKTIRMNISDINIDKDLNDKIYKSESLSRKQLKKKQKEDKKLLKKQKKDNKKNKEDKMADL